MPTANTIPFDKQKVNALCQAAGQAEARGDWATVLLINLELGIERGMESTPTADILEWFGRQCDLPALLEELKAAGQIEYDDKAVRLICPNGDSGAALGSEVAGSNQAKPPKLGFYTEADLNTTNIKPPVYIMRPILPRGRLVLLVGNSTAGKTPFLMQLVNDLVGGRDFLDYFKNEAEEPLNVAFIDAESSKEDIVLRLKKQRSARPLPKRGAGKLLWTDRDKTSDEEYVLASLNPRTGIYQPDVAKLYQVVQEERIDVLVLDNLWALSNGADVSKGQIATTVIKAIGRILKLPWKPTVVLVHHPRKTGANDKGRPSILEGDFIQWLENLSGSMVWVNRTDVRLGLERVHKNGDECTVLRGRHRVPGVGSGEQDIGPLFLTIDDEHDIAALDNSLSVLDSFGPKARELAMRLRNVGRFTRKEAKSPAIRGTELTKRTVDRVINQLKAHVILSEDGNGVFTWVGPAEAAPVEVDVERFAKVG